MIDEETIKSAGYAWESELGDNDMILIWDQSVANEREDLIKNYGATKGLPQPLKKICIGDLKKYFLKGIVKETPPDRNSFAGNIQIQSSNNTFPGNGMTIKC